MAIRVRCKCGKSLKISSRHADKRIACPGCQRPFRIPAEKFRSAGSPSGGGNATQKVSPPDSVGASAPVPVSLDEELAGSGLIELSSSGLGDLVDHATGAGDGPMEALTILESPQQVSYAPDRTARIQSTRRGADPIEGPKRGFWSDVLVSFIYPVKGVSNLVTLVIIFVVSAIGESSSQLQMGLLGAFIQFWLFVIMFGWFASIYFGVIQETATGSEDLPGLNLEDGWWDGILMPAFRYLGAIGLVLLPAICLTIASGMGWVPSFVASLIPIWFIGGVFLLPMSFLLFSFQAAGTMLRIDLVLATIAKTILPYLAMWAILLVVSCIILIARGGSAMLGTMVGVSMPSISANQFLAGLGGRILLSWIGIYFTLVAMRTIGLYYLHFKKRFVFVME